MANAHNCFFTTALKSHYVEVMGSSMHYFDEGEGDPIVFLHGIPSSSYSWRNIIPKLTSLGRCIAPDLIGFGNSDKPDIDYMIHDHIDYINGFIEALGLRNITFVLHAWGSLIGFNYAAHHPNNVKALIFFESHIRPVENRDMLSLPVQEVVGLLQTQSGRESLLNTDYYLNNIFLGGILKDMAKEDITAYQAPIATPASRRPILQYLDELPKGDSAGHAQEIISHYAKRLSQSGIPKLMLYGVPGFITTIDTVAWAKSHLPNLTLVDIGDALHYPQETNPELLVAEILKWFKEAL
ncbi:MAG: haloalkane dehalogenase [Legionellales bacterium]|nr:haloalkane dehalogenase [Legionellales bacterium]|tara:strand:+ start:12684 stop:13571 length:888 start_codon:yes stop_codon:yes gene_type:complete